MKIRNYIKQVQLGLLALIGITMTACASTPLVFTPIDGSKAHSVASQVVHLKHKNWLEVYFNIRSFEGQTFDMAGYNQLWKIASSFTGGGDAVSAKLPHKGIRLLLTVEQYKNNEWVLLKSEIVVADHARSEGDLEVGGSNYDPGDYKFTVETLDNDERLKNIKTAITVYTPASPN